MSGLTILAEVEPKMYCYGSTRFKCRKALCRCGCGKEFVTNLSPAKTGKVQSCGCRMGRNADGSYRKRRPFTTRSRSNSIPLYVASIFRAYRQGAQRRHLAFDLTLDEFTTLIGRPCHYCDAPPRFHVRSGTAYNGPVAWNGVDRSVNDLGYTTENSVPCCSDCNSAKSRRSESEFLSLVSRIFKHRKLT